MNVRLRGEEAPQASGLSCQTSPTSPPTRPPRAPLLPSTFRLPPSVIHHRRANFHIPPSTSRRDTSCGAQLSGLETRDSGEGWPGDVSCRASSHRRSAELRTAKRRLLGPQKADIVQRSTAVTASVPVAGRAARDLEAWRLDRKPARPAQKPCQTQTRGGEEVRPGGGPPPPLLVRPTLL
ncbi:hypothetical protein GY45DRAFT_172683 [Cubamyces sp. BRFM 1775]|nr:hypothetical protein GY45DRAFT_172683 [Cubamyces sp. BRFM 1775]